jgi:hypothetical protein
MVIRAEGLADEWFSRKKCSRSMIRYSPMRNYAFRALIYLEEEYLLSEIGLIDIGEEGG